MCDRYLIQSTCIQYSTESYLIDLRKAYRDRLSTFNNIWYGCYHLGSSSSLEISYKCNQTVYFATKEGKYVKQHQHSK